MGSEGLSFSDIGPFLAVQMAHLIFWILDEKFIDLMLEKYQCIRETEQQWFNCLQAMPSGVLLFNSALEEPIF